ncbi:MAG: FKBP-type peptidyl-prolyl cis-trans isomerase [Vicinamibacterales bacterium]
MLCRVLPGFLAAFCLAAATTLGAQAPSSSLQAPPDVAAPPADAVRKPSGLIYKVLQPGTGGQHPTAADLVTVHYTGWTPDGRMFDSSVERGEPATFPVNRAIKGWIEGIEDMVPGEKRRLWIPQALAYAGQRGRPQGTIVFDVELIDVMASPETPPPDVSAPPADAIRTASGLAYKVLRQGTGTEGPGPASEVTVHYSGWTASDGKLFDSSVMRGTPATFRVSDVVDGWTEGLQLMTVGERMRFWIPEELAYKGEAGSPAGMLVFDVELLSFRTP